MRAKVIGGALALLAAAPVPAGRQALGQYGRWGAFRDAAPARCYAIAEPLGGEGGAASATVSTWPAARVRSQVQFHLRRPAAGPVTATAGGTSVPLTALGDAAWPADVRGDRRLAAALRGGGVLDLRGRGADGRRFHDRYPLDGAASAIDAARLACLR